MAIKNSKAIKKAVDSARKRTPIVNDSNFLSVMNAEIGSPAMVYTPEGKQAYWLAPFLLKGFMCGFARVDLPCKVSQIAIFGSSYNDQLSWIDANFFDRPPSHFLKEIQTRYSELTISEPILSYDKSPAKWAWRTEIMKEDKVKFIVFITPGGWYEKVPDKGKLEWEG